MRSKQSPISVSVMRLLTPSTSTPPKAASSTENAIMAIDLRDPRYETRRLGELARAVVLRVRSARRDHWSREQVERLQRTRLQALVRQAIERSPVYRELYADMREPARARLASLPIVGKEQLMDRF